MGTSTAETAAGGHSGHSRRTRLLLLNVLIVASCALIYELLCGTLASYLLGNAVQQFSIVLGTYLFAMGAGAWLSRTLERDAASAYVLVELALACVGGLCIPALLLAVSAHLPLRPLLYGTVFVVGALVGIELPLLIKILQRQDGSHAVVTSFGDRVARALAYDYAGGLFASLLFPLVLIPRLGLVRTSVLAGALNAVVAMSATLWIEVARPHTFRVVGVVILAALVTTFLHGEAWVASATD